MSNRFMLNETSYHGHGAILNIVPEIKARGFERVLVCTDESLVRFGVSKKVTDLLDQEKVNYQMFTEIKPNPTIENVLAGVKAAKEFKADSIVAIGGGSSMDTAKAIGIIITNPEFVEIRHQRIVHTPSARGAVLNDHLGVLGANALKCFD